MRLALVLRVSIVAALLVGSVLEAQLAPGDRLRVHRATACCGLTTTTGTFAGLTPSELLLKSGVMVSVPRDSIRGLEKAVPGDSHIYIGTVIGMAAGVALGYAYGSAHPGCHGDGPCLPFLVGAVVALPAGLAGGVVGWLAGSRFRRQEWQPIDLPLRP